MKPDAGTRLKSFAGLWLLFLVNDFFFMAAKTGEQVLLVDYTFKLAALAVVLAVPELRGELKGQFALPPTWRRFLWALAGVVGLIMVSRLLYRYVEWPLMQALPETVLFSFFGKVPPTWRLFDLTFGIALTALAEELIFRALAKAVLGRFLKSFGVLAMVSGLIFGVIHWSGGVGLVVSTALLGAAFMGAYVRLGSLWPVILAHYLIDVIAFWNG